MHLYVLDVNLSLTKKTWHRWRRCHVWHHRVKANKLNLRRPEQLQKKGTKSWCVDLHVRQLNFLWTLRLNNKCSSLKFTQHLCIFSSVFFYTVMFPFNCLCSWLHSGSGTAEQIENNSPDIPWWTLNFLIFSDLIGPGRPFDLAVFEDRLWISDWEHQQLRSIHKRTGKKLLRIHGSMVQPAAIVVVHPLAKPGREKQQGLSSEQYI